MWQGRIAPSLDTLPLPRPGLAHPTATPNLKHTDCYHHLCSSSFSSQSLSSAPYRIPHTVRHTPPLLRPTPPPSPTRPLQSTATYIVGTQERTHERSIAGVSARSGRSNREARHHTPTYAFLCIPSSRRVNSYSTFITHHEAFPTSICNLPRSDQSTASPPQPQACTQTHPTCRHALTTTPSTHTLPRCGSGEMEASKQGSAVQAEDAGQGGAASGWRDRGRGGAWRAPMCLEPLHTLHRSFEQTESPAPSSFTVFFQPPNLKKQKRS